MSQKGNSGWGSIGVGAAVGGVVGLVMKDLELLRIVSYWGQVGPWVAMSALAGALLWKVRALRRPLGAVALSLGALWLLVAVSPLNDWLARDLPRRDHAEKADAVYVLGSSMQMDGELTPISMSRPIASSMIRLRCFWSSAPNPSSTKRQRMFPAPCVA